VDECKPLGCGDYGGSRAGGGVRGARRGDPGEDAIVASGAGGGPGGMVPGARVLGDAVRGRGMHSSTLQLNLSRF